MDKTAIEAIQALAHAEQINETFAGSDLSTVALPKDYQLADMERFSNQPFRFRGRFTTHIIAEYAAYLNANGNQETGVFVDSQQSKASAIINMGDDTLPLWGDHTASITLKRSAEFEALWQHKNKPHSQIDFIDFIEDWPESIVFLEDADTAMQLTTAIAAIRKLTIRTESDKTNEQGDFNASSSEFDKIEIKNNNGAPLPYGFRFACSPYEGLQLRMFECRLRGLADGKTVQLKYRIVAIDSILDDIGTEFKDKLKADITAPGISFYCGAMEYQK